MSSETPRDDTFETSVRLAIHTLVTSQPAMPPTFAEVLTGPVATAGPAPLEPRSRRWLALAAAVALIVGGLTWLAVRDRNTATPATDHHGLAAFVLPTVLPAGWHLDGMSEHASDPALPYPGMQVYASADGSRRALVEVIPWSSYPASRDHPGFASVADAEWSPADQRSDGRSVLSWPSSAMRADTKMIVVGFDEAQARSFAATLVPAGDSAYSRTAGAGYVDEANRPPTTDAAGGELRYSDDHGGDVAVQLSTGLASIDALLHPEQPAGHLFVSENPNAQSATASREIGGVVVSLTAEAGANGAYSTTDSIIAFMNALAPVSKTAWVRQADELSTAVAAQPVISTVATGFGSIVQHVGPTISGLCLQPSGDESGAEDCVGTAPVDPSAHSDQTPNGQFDFLLGDRWFVLYIGSNTPPAGTLGVTSVSHDLVEVAGLEYIVFAPDSDVDRFTFSLGGGQRTAQRPVLVG
ncbi:MAG: hypothetical protein JWM34_4049 [Ilumatobacteraceae bacterium]|nr:hypothetical protein [Ilumatobacteraceae bacterium]